MVSPKFPYPDFLELCRAALTLFRREDSATSQKAQAVYDELDKKLREIEQMQRQAKPSSVSVTPDAPEVAREVQSVADETLPDTQTDRKEHQRKESKQEQRQAPMPMPQVQERGASPPAPTPAVTETASASLAEEEEPSDFPKKQEALSPRDKSPRELESDEYSSAETSDTPSSERSRRPSPARMKAGQEVSPSVEPAAALSWKKLSLYRKKVGYMQKSLDKLIDKMQKVEDHELIQDAKALMKMLKETSLLDEIQTELIPLFEAAQTEALPGLERDLSRQLEQISTTRAQAEKLVEEVKLVQFSDDKREEALDVPRIRRIKTQLQGALEGIDKGLREIQKAQQETESLGADKLEEFAESFRKMGKEFQRAVGEAQESFTAYNESMVSRQKYKESSKISRTISRQGAVTEQPRASQKRVIEAHERVSTDLTERAKKERQIIEEFAAELAEANEGKEFTVDRLTAEQHDKLQKKFASWLKSSPHKMPQGVSRQFFLNNVNAILTELQKRLG